MKPISSFILHPSSFILHPSSFILLKMHLVLGAYLLSGTPGYRQAGIHQYSRALVEQLATSPPASLCSATPDRQTSITILVSPTALDQLAGLQSPVTPDPFPITLRPASRSTESPWGRIWVEQVETPGVLRGIAGAMYHGLAFVAPLRAACPTVVTVHDLSFITRPETHKRLNRIYLSWFTRWSCRRATRVIAVSEWTKRDVVSRLGVDVERVDVIPHGVHPRFKPLPAEEVARFKRDHAIGENAIFFLGSLEPRKNLITLIEAFAQPNLQPSTLNPQLIIGGGPGWKYEPIFERVKALGLDGRVHFAGPIAQEELPWWYNACAVFAYPSLYEGFGLPVLEAMACGMPVVTSNVTSLPEVVEDAGLLVEPLDVRGLAEALAGVLSDAELRCRMREASRRRARQFTWAAAAAQTVETYRRVWQAASEREGTN